MADNEVQFVKKNIEGLCKNIDGLDFRNIPRPDKDLPDTEKELSGINYSNIHPSVILKCVDELIEKEILFSHEFNDESKVTLDFDRKSKSGDLNSYSFNIHNIRRILTNRFGDQISLFDFNRIQSLTYDYDGSASMRYSANCEGWISYSYHGHTYNSFIRHLDQYTFIPSLEHSFINTSSNAVVNATSISSDFFKAGQNENDYFGNMLLDSISKSNNYGRVFDQSHFCRYYYSDLVDFAYGRYVQLSDMQKFSYDNINVQKLDTLEIGVSKNKSSKIKDYYINDEIKEYSGYPRVIISGKNDFIFEKGEKFIKSIGLAKDELKYGADFINLIKNKMNEIQSYVERIKKESCNNNSVDNLIDQLKLILGEGKLSFLLSNDGCLKSKMGTPNVSIDISSIYKTTDIESYSLLSPSYFLSQKDGVYNYIEAVWVNAKRIQDQRLLDSNGENKPYLSNKALFNSQKYENYFNDRGCPAVCVGDLPCIRNSIDEKYAACVSSDVDYILGCQTYKLDDKPYYRCLSLRNISQNAKIDQFDILEYLNSFEHRESITEGRDFNNDDFDPDQKNNLLNNTSYFFNLMMGHSGNNERNSIDLIDLDSHLFDSNKFVFRSDDIDYQKKCSEAQNLNINGELIFYPIKAADNVLNWINLNDGESVDDEIVCFKENESGEVVIAPVSQATCVSGVTEVDDRDCKKYAEVEFNCNHLSPTFFHIEELEGLKKNLKFFQVAPGIVRIDSYVEADTGLVSADYSNLLSTTPHDILQNYIIFDEKRSQTNISGFMFNREKFLERELVTGSNPSYRVVNARLVKMILDSYRSNSDGVNRIKSILENFGEYRNNELAQKNASCLIADFLFDDLILDEQNSLNKDSDLACYLDENKNVKDCLGAADISYLADRYHFHPQFLSQKSTYQNFEIGYPKNLLKNRDSKLVNYLFYPSVNFTPGGDLIDIKYSSLLNTKFLPDNLLSFNFDDEPSVESVEQRMYEGKARGPLHKIREYQQRFPVENKLILTTVDRCEEFRQKYPLAQVKCFPRRMRILTNNPFGELGSIFSIKGYEYVKIVGLDIEVVIDPRMVKIHSDWLQDLSEIDNNMALKRLEYLTEFIVNQPKSGPRGIYLNNAEILIRLEQSKFLFAHIFQLHREKFFIGDKLICDGKEFLTDLTLAESKEFWHSFVDKYFETVSPVCEGYKYVLKTYLDNYIIESFDLFDITDNEYVEISDIKLRGVTRQNFVNLYGNLYQELDGIYFDNKVVDYSDLIYGVLRNKYKDKLNKNNVVLNLDNGKSSANFFKDDGFYIYNSIFLYPGLPLDKYFLSFDIDSPNNFYSLFTSHHVVIPYLNDGNEMSRHFEFSDFDEKSISKFYMREYLNDIDFISYYNNELPEENPGDLRMNYLDVNDYSHHRQCYRNSKIAKCLTPGEERSCKIFDTCSDDLSCEAGLVCHPDLKFCTTSCEGNFSYEESSVKSVCGNVGRFPESKCVNNFCHPAGCNNLYTTILNSTFDSCKNNETSEDRGLILLNNINGFIFNNEFLPMRDNCIQAKVVDVKNDFDDRNTTIKTDNGIRLERNLFNKSKLEMSGNGNAIYAGSIFNNIFLNTNIILSNSNWRSYWLNNLFSNTKTDENELNCCLFEDRSDYRYFFSAPFYGRHIFKNNIFNIPNQTFMNYVSNHPYKVEALGELVGDSNQPARRYDFDFILSNNTFIETGDLLSYRPYKSASFFDSLYDLSSDKFHGYKFNMLAYPMTYFRLDTLESPINFESVDDVWNFYHRNECYVDGFTYLKKPFDIGDGGQYLIKKSWMGEEYLNIGNYLPGENIARYPKNYHIRKDFFGKPRRANSLHGPIEDDGAVQQCN